MKCVIKDLDLLTARMITLNQALEYMVLPLYIRHDSIYALVENDNKKARDLLAFIFKKKIKLLKMNKEKLINIINSVFYTADNLEECIFKEAVSMNASDIHFEPVNNIVHVRYRISGRLILVRKILVKDYLKVLSRLKILGNMDITEKRKPQDGKVIMNVGQKRYNCRLSTMPVLSGEKLVFRIIYEEKYQKLSELNFSIKQKEKIKKIMNISNGLVIVNGPTGSGKTTTLYSMLGEIKDDDINITTLEDPVEITMDGINQISLNPKKNITFAEGLRGILRQDPDVIMVGEIRDEETAKMAVRSSITGHRVYSTIHTKSPREVYFRLEDMGVEEYLIRSSLVGIISQRLVSLLCEDCKEFIGEKIINLKRIKLYKKCGCDRCNGTGIKERTLISSVFYIDKLLREKIKDIHNDEELLSNKEMLKVLDKLLEEEKIDYYDYLKFIQGEELDGIGL